LPSPLRSDAELPLGRIQQRGMRCDAAHHGVNQGGPTQWVWVVCAGPDRWLLAWEMSSEG
jgi:hypothetical protein